MSDEARIQTGHLGKLWDDEFKYFKYVRQPVTNAEVAMWQNMGYDYVKSFTGVMYDNKNPMPKWVNTLENAFGMFKQTYTFYKMETLEIMPVHSDHYRTYCRLNNAEPKDVWRVILMLEDWKPGHYFELDGVGYTNWKAGDWFKWRGDTPHAAANIGIEPRYTLQITGLSIYIGQLNTLLPFNLPNVPELKEGSHPFVRHVIKPVVNPTRNFDKPYMVYMNNSYIKELDEINHDDTARNRINNNGLSIYLYEPLCSYHKDKPQHTQGFYSEFDSNVKPEDLRADELDSILKYIERNRLTNVTVHTGDNKVSEWYPHYKDRMNLICDDLFLKTQENIIGLDNSPSREFTKKFICLNWRYTKHRHLVSTFLAGRDGYLSWYFKSDLEQLKRNLYFDLSSWEHNYPHLYNRLKNGIDDINQNGPYYVDKDTKNSVALDDLQTFSIWPIVKDYQPGMTPALFNATKNTLQPYYRDVFLDVINETRFGQPTGNFSEKVFQAVQFMKPFVLVAPPKTLEYVKSLGFKTFDKYWDESYDNETDHGERMAKIFNTIDSIIEKPIEELRSMYDDMLPILQHNLEVYKENFVNPNYNWNNS